jgi:hypothetical protein
LVDPEFLDYFYDSAHSKQIGRFIDLFYKCFSADGFKFTLPKLLITESKNYPLGFSRCDKSILEAMPDDLAIGLRTPDIFRMNKPFQLGVVAHELIHNIILQAAIAVRDNKLEETHPLYETGLYKLIELTEANYDPLCIWSAYKALPEERVCIANQNYVYNAYKDRILSQ